MWIIRRMKALTWATFKHSSFGVVRKSLDKRLDKFSAEQNICEDSHLTQRHFGYSINVQIPRLNVKTCEIPHFFFIYWPHLLTTFLVTSDTDDRYLQDVEIPEGCLCLMLTCRHGWSAERGYWQSALLVQYWYQKTCVHADREHGTDVWQHQTQQTCYLVNP